MLLFHDVQCWLWVPDLQKKEFALGSKEHSHSGLCSGVTALSQKVIEIASGTDTRMWWGETHIWSLRHRII